MKIRLLSKYGDALALLNRLADEGASVDFWVKAKLAREGYKGILKQVPHYSGGLSKDTLILFDMVGLGSVADGLRKSGYRVYGAGGINDSLELNREFGMKMAKTYGLKVPKWQRFNSFDKARDFVFRNGSEVRWVFKPQDNKSPAFTYDSSDQDDMIEMLSYFEGQWKNLDFILQEHIDGVEVSIEAFYQDGKQIPNTLNSTFESKRFLEGDKGMNTGCMGSVVRFWRRPDPKLYKLTLGKISPMLQRFKYSGPLDCNVIISENDKMPYFLEWTTRFGYDAIYALCEGIESLSDFLSDILDGKAIKPPSYSWLGAVRVSIPPYPYKQKAAESADKPIRGLGDSGHIWLLDAKERDGKYLSAGVDGVIAECTGRAKTLNELGKKIYQQIDKLRIPDKQYRSDIIKNAEKRIQRLKSWKFF